MMNDEEKKEGEKVRREEEKKRRKNLPGVTLCLGALVAKFFKSARLIDPAAGYP